ncbi:2-hydroxyacid dehydrogenase [Actinocorallia sp. A-T 12471]|uniref:2-hydroxyacid dehydrogenase n=1 Tax=Actinocorallia sp. A-T 12471 TaxID=3089813 RepID=UPI0029D3E843|nr:2-hydroxyacid dehydrogenase [Actinocorallia sp. A-T 12471]MDX6742403.1 2-hydroxyacid dehydrogenase [Actinocorallia sp. A-T 12471]
MLVILPSDAPADALGPLPASVETVALDAPEARDAEFCVLDARQRAEFAERLPDLRALRVVQTLNAGVDWLPPLPEGVALCNASGAHDVPVAEWIVGVVLAANRDLPRHIAAQARGEWDTAGNTAHGEGPGSADLADQRVLVVGHGSIGRALEQRLKAFGTSVTGVAGHAREGVHGPDDLPGLLPDADVVVLLAPATAATRGLVDAAFLERMRPGALLVNAARGALVDTDALVAALHAGRVRAALDCTDPEPLPPGHPLWSAPGVIITPHVAGSSARWRERAYRLAGDQIRRHAAGEPLVNLRRHGY